MVVRRNRTYAVPRASSLRGRLLPTRAKGENVAEVVPGVSEQRVGMRENVVDDLDDQEGEVQRDSEADVVQHRERFERWLAGNAETRPLRLSKIHTLLVRDYGLRAPTGNLHENTRRIDVRVYHFSIATDLRGVSQKLERSGGCHCRRTIAEPDREKTHGRKSRAIDLWDTTPHACAVGAKGLLWIVYVRAIFFAPGSAARLVVSRAGGPPMLRPAARRLRRRARRRRQ
jgi:hypothetical protein